MREMPATTFRKSLFRVLADVSRAIPARIRYKKGDAVILSYEQYRNLLQKKGGRSSARGKVGKRPHKLKPLIKGMILKPLGEEADEELRRYIGIE